MTGVAFWPALVVEVREVTCELVLEEFVHLLNENRILYKKGKLYYLYSPYKYKGYVKYLKENGKMVMKFTLKGEKFIEDYFNKER